MRHGPAMRGCAAAAALALAIQGCGSTRTVELPAPDLAGFEGMDALIMLTAHQNAMTPPTDMVQGRGAGALEGMAGWTGGLAQTNPGSCSGSMCGAGVVLLLGIYLLGLPIAAAAGAGAAHSTDEIEAATEAFDGVLGDRALFGSLDARLAGRLRAAGRWDCVDTAQAGGAPVCAAARRPASLIVDAVFGARASGRFSPDVTLVALARARLVGEGGAAAELGWRYESAPKSFFALADEGGAGFRAAVGVMLDRLADAIARDLLLSPHAVTVTLGGRPRAAHLDRNDPKPNMRRDEGPGFLLRRMAPEEMAQAGFPLAGRAVVTAAAGCVVSGVDRLPPEPLAALDPAPETVSVTSVVAGRHVLSLSCDATGGEDVREIEATVERGRLYCTDGRVVAEASAPHRC